MSYIQDIPVLLNQSSRRLSCISLPVDAGDTHSSVSSVVDICKTLSRECERSPMHLTSPARHLQRFWRILRPWAEFALSQYIIGQTETPSDRTWCFNDPNGNATTVALPIIHLLGILSSSDTVCRDMVEQSSFCVICVKAWLIVLPHPAFVQELYEVVADLSEIDANKIGAQVRQIALAVPSSVLDTVISEYPATIRPSKRRDSAYLPNLQSLFQSLALILNAQPRHSVFVSPAFIHWLVHMLKNLCREISTSTTCICIVCIIDCLDDVLPLTHYDVTVNVVRIGLLDGIQKAVQIISPSGLDTAMKAHFHDFIAHMFGFLQGALIYLPVLRQVRRRLQAVKYLGSPHAHFSIVRAWSRLQDACTLYGSLYEARRANRRCFYSEVCPFRSVAPEYWSYCSSCGDAIYCSKQCQKAHWRSGHREDCKPQAENTPLSLKLKYHRFMEDVTTLELTKLQHLVKNQRRWFASRHGVNERDVIAILNYRYGFQGAIAFRRKEQDESCWNTDQSYMIEVLALGGVHGGCVWHTEFVET